MEEMELAMNQTDHEEPVKTESPRWYEGHISLEDAKTFIKANIATAARSFIAIGFYLKCVRDRELFLEEDHPDVWEFAKSEYGISKSTASRYMSMNDRFSENGNSPNVREEYRSYGKSQLQEMLYLEEDQLEQVTPEHRVEDIRGMRKPKEVPYIELPGQMEIEIDFPEYMPEPSASPMISQKQTFEMSVEDMLSGEGQESIAISQQNHETDMEENQEQKGTEDLEQESPKRDFFTTPLGCPNREVYSYTIAVENKLVPTDGTEIKSPETLIEEPETVLDQPETIIDGEFVELPPERELSSRSLLEEEKADLHNMIKVFQEEGMEMPPIVERQKIIVAALASLVAEMERPEPEPEPAKQDQPELPILKNNDQRAAFVDAYETWPLWIETKETGERYYRYDLPDDTNMVVKVYHARIFDYKAPGSYEDKFKEGWGEAEYYLLKEGSFFRNCRTSRPDLIEKLKEIQKKK